MRLLVTGAGGLLGGRLAALLQDQGFEVLAVWRRTAPPAGLSTLASDLLREGEVERLLDAVRPDGVLNAAVLGRADLCQQRPDDARETNSELPRRLARACSTRGIRLVTLSTDLVFGGDSSPYGEADPARPLNVYGQTKRAGEQAVLAAFPAAAVARVALVLGQGHGARGTASESVAWALAAGRPLRLFEDEYRTPVDAASVADACGRLLNGSAHGLFHLGGPERVSRYELGVRVARVLALGEGGIIPARQRDYPGPDARPADVSLDSTRASRELGWRPRCLDDAIREGRRQPS